MLDCEFLKSGQAQLELWAPGFRPQAPGPERATKQPNLFFFLLFFSFLFFFWLHQVLVAVRGLLSCGMRALSCGMHMGSSSLTRDQTRAPCLGSSESYPLRHQGSPNLLILIVIVKYKATELLQCALCCVKHSTCIILLGPHIVIPGR